MKRLGRVTTAILLVALLGCGGGEQPPEPAPPAPVSARGPADDPVDVGGPPSDDERRQFEADLAEQIAKLEKQLRSVRRAAETESGSLREELSQRTEVLEAKSGELKRKLDSMREAGRDEWLELRRDASRLVGDIQAESGRMIEALD